MIDWIKMFGRWIIRIAIYLWGRRIVCIALLVFVGVILFIWCISDKSCDDQFRLTGLALELLGIGAVIHGLNGTLKSFKCTLRSIISELFKEFPKFEVNNNGAIFSGEGNGFRSGGTGTGCYSPAPSTLPDEQVALLWEILNRMNVRMREIERQLTLESKNRLMALNNERSEREASVGKVQQKLEKFAVEGLAIEAMGVVCLVLGAIFATASTELACFFDSFPVLLMALNTE